MREDEIWKAFKETGEPACYLLYRAVRGEINEIPPVS